MYLVKVEEFLCCLLLCFVSTIISEPETSVRNNHYDRSCLDLLEEYAAQASNFTKCFIKHARPITVCLNCVQHYMNVKESYINITKFEGEIPGEFCKAELMNLDSLEVIADSFNYVQHLWEKASCSKCFNDTNTTRNNETQNLLVYLETTNNCINRTNQTTNSSEEICRNCYNSYFELNDYYDNQGSYTAFCMDIVDAMNSTRVKWSVTLGCCMDRLKPETVFLMTVIIALLIPILFYLLIWICSNRTTTQITDNQRWTRRFLQMSINN